MGVTVMGENKVVPITVGVHRSKPKVIALRVSKGRFGVEISDAIEDRSEKSAWWGDGPSGWLK